MWPRMEKVTNPAKRQVPVLTKHVIIASLKREKGETYCCTKIFFIFINVALFPPCLLDAVVVELVV